MQWIKDRGLTLTLLGIFGVCWLLEICAGHAAFNEERRDHGRPPISLAEYMTHGQPWEATFENWESEFLEMGAFVMLTAFLYQKGSPESRRPGVRELVDADPRDFRDHPDAPAPVRRGGATLWLYERSLGLAFAGLFVFAFAAHVVTGWRAEVAQALIEQLPPPTFSAFARSSKFWFQSMQNWQSEFLGIASMVWLSVYLRHRGSPESKPVHAPHSETGH